LSNEEMTNIKFVDHEKLWNFVVENFFIWIRLGHQNMVWKIALPSVLLWHSVKKSLPSFFLTLGKETSLSSVFYLTLDKAFFAEYRGFSECFLFGSRQEADSGSAYNL
jgi:hypothetical protein